MYENKNVVLNGSGSRNSDATEIRFLRSLSGCVFTDQGHNTTIHGELYLYMFYKKESEVT
jgi:hypothetical protein